MVKIHEDSMVVQNGVSNQIETNGHTAVIKAKNSISLDANGDLYGHLNGEKGLKSPSAKTPERTSELPEANLQLVERARALMKQEWDDEEDSHEIYSRPHYDEIMDQSSPNTCWRYLLQRDQNVEDAVELMKANMKWRKENNIDHTLADPRDMVKDFWLRAPIGFTGKTRNGNDLVYAIGKNFRKPDSSVKQLIRGFISYILFEWDSRHKHDLEQFELVFDVSDTGLRNIDLDFSQWLVSIRDCAPARVKAVYFVGIPFLIRPVIRLIISWLPERFSRIAFCGTYDELVRANIDDEFIPEEIGGKSDSRWRLAPIHSRWAHEIDDPEFPEKFDKICKACNFNTSQEHLDKLYQMQRDYEKGVITK